MFHANAHPVSLDQLGGFKPCHSDLSSVATLRQRALAQLSDALQVIAPQKKLAYNEALRRCPNLVTEESDPFKFMVFTQFNAWSAAERLTGFWMKRYELFGERAFLPMDLSPGSALDAETIAHIKCGAWGLTSDRVLVVDQSLETFDASPEARVRRSFFFGVVMMKLDASEMEGNGFRAVMRSYHGARPGVTHAVTNMLVNIFPVRLEVVHIIFLRQDRQTLLRYILPMMLEHLGHYSKNLKVHNCASPVEVRERLGAHGIAPNELPISLGGTYNPHGEFIRFLFDQKLPITVSAMIGVLGADQASAAGLLDSLSERSCSSTMFNPGSVIEGTIVPKNFQIRMGSEGSGTIGVASITPSSTNMNGSEPGSSVLPQSNSDTSLVAVHEAFRLLPPAEKAAYEEALRRAPHLIEKESNPLTFLKFDGFDAKKAAKRLACYWKHRLAIFEERAFNPLTLSEALGEEERDILNTGYLLSLPNDEQGRGVLSYDAAKSVGYDVKQRLRCAFYVTANMIQNPVSVADGIVFILVFGGQAPPHQRAWNNGARMIADMFKEGLPLRIAVTHIVYCPREKHFFFSHVFPLVVKVYTTIFNQQTQYHVSEDENELIKQFENFGISKQSLPKSIGGEVEVSDLYASLEKKKQLPDLLSMDSGPKPTTSKGDSIESSAASIDKMMAAIGDMEPAEKAALVEAQSKAPALVEKESEYARFLRGARFDAVEAARMLARYWYRRKDVFGDRAFLPMNQTGDGALDRKDVGVLQSGYLIQLPCSPDGSSVIYCDGTKLQKSTRQSRLRCTFYIWSVMSENELSQTDGYNVLYHVTEPSFDRASKDCLDHVLGCIPAELKTFRLLGVVPEGMTREEYETGQMKTTASILGDVISNRIVKHVGPGRGTLARNLESHGFSLEWLPKSICGNWGFEEFVEWQELRIRHEWGLSISTGARAMAERYSIPTKKAPSAELTDSDKNERKRRMNVIHSRRKRERERLEVEELQEQAEVLKGEKNRLEKEHARLEDLLKQAQELVAKHG